MHQGFGEIRQVAYLTTDIEHAMRQWLEKSGLGPFTWFQNVTLDMDYRGEPSRVEMHVALAFRGRLQIELIQQLNDAPSPYLEYFQAGCMGLHHVAYLAEDRETSLAQARDAGHEVIARIDDASGRYAYFIDPGMPENIFELLEVGPDLQAFWDHGIEEAAAWDGSNPVRPVDMSRPAG